MKIIARLTVFFEDPFWVGVCEREQWGDNDSEYEVCRIVFGAEPKDYDVYSFILRNYSALQFSSRQNPVPFSEKKVAPKKRQREIHKLLNHTGAGTKAQQALKLQREEGKLYRKRLSRAEREEEKKRKFELNQKKRMEKHRGH